MCIGKEVLVIRERNPRSALYKQEGARRTHVTHYLSDDSVALVLGKAHGRGQYNLLGLATSGIQVSQVLHRGQFKII